MTFVVVPLDGEAAVECTGPVCGDFVEGLEGGDEMLGIVFVDVLDPKVIVDEGEDDVACGVAPQAGSVFHGYVALFGEMLGEALVGDDAGLFESVHALADFDVDPSVAGD